MAIGARQQILQHRRRAHAVHVAPPDPAALPPGGILRRHGGGAQQALAQLQQGRGSQHPALVPAALGGLGQRDRIVKASQDLGLARVQLHKYRWTRGGSLDPFWQRRDARISAELGQRCRGGLVTPIHQHQHIVGRLHRVGEQPVVGQLDRAQVRGRPASDPLPCWRRGAQPDHGVPTRGLTRRHRRRRLFRRAREEHPSPSAAARREWRDAIHARQHSAGKALGYVTAGDRGARSSRDQGYAMAA